MQGTTFEDVYRVLVRRRRTVLLAVVVATLLAAAYGRASNSAVYEAESSVYLTVPNVILTDPAFRLDPVNLSAQARRLETNPESLLPSGGDKIRVTSDGAASSMYFSARDTSAEAANGLALQAAEAFVNQQRAQQVDLFTRRADYAARQLEVIKGQLAAIETRIEAIASTTSQVSVGLEGERIALVSAAVDFTAREAADRLNAQQTNAGLSEPTLSRPAQQSAWWAWIPFAVAGAFFGLLLGIGIALVRNAVDHRVRSRRDLELVSPDTRVLGVLEDRPSVDEVGTLQLRLGRIDTRAVSLLVCGDAEASERVRSIFSATDIKLLRESPAADDQGSVVIVAVSGRTTDVDYATAIDSLSVDGLAPAGALLVEVPRKEAAWARRPQMSTAPRS
jgi:hypothetical protein